MKGDNSEFEKITYRHSSRCKKGGDTDSRVNHELLSNSDIFGLTLHLSEDDRLCEYMGKVVRMGARKARAHRPDEFYFSLSLRIRLYAKSEEEGRWDLCKKIFSMIWDSCREE